MVELAQERFVYQRSCQSSFPLAVRATPLLLPQVPPPPPPLASTPAPPYILCPPDISINLTSGSTAQVEKETLFSPDPRKK